MIVRDYVPGEPLTENEFLLKIRDDKVRKWDRDKGEYIDEGWVKTGFLSKLTQKGQLPKAFEDWGKTYNDRTPLQTYVFQEDYASGWKIIKWRFGQSQNWATMRHPQGFTVEIYLQQLLEIIQEHNVDVGVLIGEFRWADHRLHKK